jgi:DNA-binding NarL/FixJ family response regulator
MDQQWVRGRRAKDIFLSPSEFAAASQAFRELQKRVPFVAQLIADGLTKKEICQRLKWSAQTLRYVLADFKLGFAKRDDVYRRIYRKAS